MKPRDWAAFGFRLLAIYLFVQALFWSVATLYCTICWIFSKPMFDGSHSATFYTALTALVSAVQATSVGYWYWFDADNSADTRCLESDGDGAVDPIAPLVMLAVATWGVVGMLHAMRQVIRLWITQQSSLLSFSEWLEEPWASFALCHTFIHFAVVMTFAIAPRMVVSILLWCTPGSGRAIPEPNEATSA